MIHYRVIEGDGDISFQRLLNESAEAGWRLVQYVPILLPDTYGDGSSRPIVYTAVMELEETRP